MNTQTTNEIARMVIEFAYLFGGADLGGTPQYHWQNKAMYLAQHALDSQTAVWLPVGAVGPSYCAMRALCEDRALRAQAGQLLAGGRKLHAERYLTLWENAAAAPVPLERAIAAGATPVVILTTLDDLVLDPSQEPVRDALASPHHVRGENEPPRWRIPLTGVASLLEVDRISAVALGWRGSVGPSVRSGDPLGPPGVRARGDHRRRDRGDVPVSVEIVYRRAVVRVPSSTSGLSQDLFVLVAQSGCSRTYESNSGRRARSWNAWAAGAPDACMRRIIHIAGDCAGGNIHMGHKGNDLKPATFIEGWRRILTTVKPQESPCATTIQGQHLAVSFCVPAADPEGRRQRFDGTLAEYFQLPAIVEALENDALFKLIGVSGPDL